jgi:anti-anti-sigma regulatory factor
MPERVDLGQETRLADKRIVGRHRAVIAQPQYFAAVEHSVLCAFLFLALADGQVQVPVPSEHHPAAEVVVDLTVAVQVGLVLACLFFVARVSRLTRIERLAAPGEGFEGVEAYRLSGSLFFGTASRFDDLLDPRRPAPRVLILELENLLNMDTTGQESLEALRRSLERRGAVLVVAGMREQPANLARRSGFAAEIGGENLVGDLDAAWRRAREVLSASAPGSLPSPPG